MTTLVSCGGRIDVPTTPFSYNARLRGGVSAIAGVPELDASEEIDRVVPIVDWIRAAHPETFVSVDTYKPRVAEAVLDAGADIINDVSGLLHPELVDHVGQRSAVPVIMHTAAPPKVRMQQSDLYRDIGAEVCASWC